MIPLWRVFHHRISWPCHLTLICRDKKKNQERSQLKKKPSAERAESSAFFILAFVAKPWALHTSLVRTPNPG